MRNAVADAERQEIRTAAFELLRSPFLFSRFLDALERLGLAGEQENALALLVVATSRVLKRPLNAFLKGPSGGGKNWLATRVFTLLPRSSVIEITSASARSWNYAGDALRHKVIYLQERNERSDDCHPLRLLISENRIVRAVTVREGSRFFTKRFVTEGPVAAISTTTKQQLTIDDETRHVSLWLDESPEQTLRIAKSYVSARKVLRPREIKIWRRVQKILETKIGMEVQTPLWFEQVAERLLTSDIRIRRYFPFYVEACKTVSLIRSFQKPKSDQYLEIDFIDLALTSLIFDRVFLESLHHGRSQNLETRKAVEHISSTQEARGVDAERLAKHLQISKDRAYDHLRRAADAGLIKRANQPQKGNLKLYLPTPPRRFIPDPRVLFRKMNVAGRVRFVHPVTREWVEFH